MIHIKRMLLAGVTTLALAVGVASAAPQTAYADASTEAAKSAACQGAGGTVNGTTCTTAGPSLDDIVANVVNILSILVGIAAVIMIIVGGFRYVTSGGDSGNMNTAKQTIMYAIIGLVIVVFAQFMVQYVIQETTKPPANAKEEEGS